MPDTPSATAPRPEMVLAMPGYETDSRQLAAAIGATYSQISVHYFPDGESKVTVPAELPARVAVYQSQDRPNAKLVELLLAARAARAQGARELTLIAPYLAYMRQDAAFHAGEAVSQQIIGDCLARLFEALVTVDPHLHRVSRLSDAVPVEHPVAVSAAPAIREHLAARGGAPLLVGPDAESLQWVQAVGGDELDIAVAEKTRRGDYDVEIALADAATIAGREVVLIDDIASTGRTLAAAARHVHACGAARVDAVVTHALFVGDARERLAAARVTEIASTTSIRDPSNCIDLTPLLAGAFA